MTEFKQMLIKIGELDKKYSFCIVISIFVSIVLLRHFNVNPAIWILVLLLHVLALVIGDAGSAINRYSKEK